jgi:pyrroline-5-carboxylate reductase
VLCVKPTTIASVLQEILPVWQQHQPLIISVAAGFKVAAMQRELGNKASIIRAMPNMAALVGSGATGLYANTNVSTEKQEMAESILRSVGIIHWVEAEDQLDKLTSLSGSGPGYLFYMMEAMANQAIDFGLDPDSVHLFTAQTFLGAARIALESEQTFEQLRQNICSKGGTTEQGVQVLKQHHMRQALEEAMQATYERARAIGEQLSGPSNHD